MNKRKANVNDIPTLVELRKKQLIDEGEKLSADSGYNQQLTDYFTSSISDETFISWVIEDGGEIVATSGLCFYSLPPSFSNPSGRNAYITNMYTKPEYRRRGIAAELLDMVIAEAKERDYTVARLHTSEYGRSIYQKAGFKYSEDYMAMRL
jgi:ribosomal protein S18 acetylase RimI-like enzyme